MHNLIQFNNEEERTLALALQNLPAPNLPKSAWPNIEAAVRARRKTAIQSRFPWRIAAALALLTIIPLVHRLHSRDTPGEESIAKINSAAFLIRQSQLLEQQLQAVRNVRQVSMPAAQALLSNQVEDLILMIDTQIESERDPNKIESLWANRVDMLENLSSIQIEQNFPATLGAQFTSLELN